MNIKPLLSICIPTKNRQYYCVEVIKHILAYNNENFELCIHDHSDDKSIESAIKVIKDKRLKYKYTKEEISSVENMSRSIEMASGKYICMIGDDDIVLPNIFECVDFMEANDVDSFCYGGIIPDYVWPNNKESGRLNIFSGKEIEKIVDKNVLEKKLKRLFRNGIINYQRYNLPRLYHGIIKKSVLDEISYKVGSYFRGLSPDIYSTVALSSLVSKHCISGCPISIAGVCSQSTSAQNRDGQHQGSLDKAIHLKNNKNYDWDSSVPKYYSVETIWAETAIKSAKHFDINVYQSFNLFLFTLFATFKNRNIFRIVSKEMFKPFTRKYIFKCMFVDIIFTLRFMVIELISRIYNKIFKSKKTYYNLPHINLTVDIIE
ncbi:glycosyltransferase family 2 protein [Francisella tularensis subsp. novicida FSC159]|uniref:glycosyltransferase family 2 protein n=1 Tax=Francisella tularensis TaxID=263 RepID=UPI001C0EC50A|nr:glycosyltransferase family A protein [Francisella tularensis]MBK2111617.1 glycosyltransferase family 2 protein [Francisella tularensis subsp. novicida FSC159]